MKFNERINIITKKYKVKALDCDGQSRLYNWALRKQGVQHEVHFGIVYVNGLVFPIHYWITFPDQPQYVLDSKLQKWFSGDNVPDGLYHKGNYPNVLYVPYGKDTMEISDAIASFLIQR